jgi:hypothetical protein
VLKDPKCGTLLTFTFLVCKDVRVGNNEFAPIINVQQDEQSADNCEELSGVLYVDPPQIGTQFSTLVSHLQD